MLAAQVDQGRLVLDARHNGLALSARVVRGRHQVFVRLSDGLRFDHESIGFG